MTWEPDYLTVQELKNFVTVQHNADDDEVASAIAAASRAIDRHCNRQFGKVDAAETRYFTAEYDSPLYVWITPLDDVMTETDLAIEVESTGDAITSYKLMPRNAAQKGMPWTHLAVDASAGVVPTYLEDDVAVTAIWGWSTVPPAVRFACKLQASRFLNRRGSPYGIAGSPSVGSELRLLSKVDPDVGVSLRKYVRQARPL
jgi:hypothetical protein